MQNIVMFKPLIEQEEIEASKTALELGWLGMGSLVSEFESELKKYIEAPDRELVVLSTGHAALHLSLLLAGVTQGDEVITPSFNNVADFQAILATGAEPVFCDILDNTLCIDLEKAEKLITPKTKAMIVMDYGCHFCEHEDIARFAEKYNLRIVHDAAHSFGSRYKQKMVGSFSDMTMFSFDPIKNITCLDGGALIVKSPEELRILQEMRFVGMGQAASVLYQNKRVWSYDVQRLGFRYHMNNMHAAIGLAQLKKMDRIKQSRQAACVYYNTRFAEMPFIRTPDTTFEDTTPFMYFIRVPAEHRDPLRIFMDQQGCESGVHWKPGHQFSLFKNYRCGDLSVTEKMSEELITLPLYSCMDFKIIDQVVDLIHEYFVKNPV